MVATAFGAAAPAIPYVWRGDLPPLYVSAAMAGISLAFYVVLLHNAIGLVSRPHERTRNFSHASMMGAATAFIGPLGAGIAIDRLGNPLACGLMAVFPVLGTALLAGWGNHLPHAARGHSALAHSDREGYGYGLIGILVASAVVQLGQDAVQLYVPVFGHSLGLSASAIGVVLACFAAASFLSRFIMPRLTTVLGSETLLGYSLYVAALGFVVMPLCPNAGTLALASFVVGVGMGCGHPITTMLTFSRSPGGRSGSTLGLRQSITNVMRMGGPALFGVAAVGGLPAVFWMNGLLMSAGGFVARRVRPDTR